MMHCGTRQRNADSETGSSGIVRSIGAVAMFKGPFDYSSIANPAYCHGICRKAFFSVDKSQPNAYSSRNLASKSDQGIESKTCTTTPKKYCVCETVSYAF
mmetsp:Transcript_5487/g.8411  ORF Transcript_5487/g.8411 Transcript_5487/m.8411 type:complete len:100 (+) Transcript_5487:772-1071(+)